MSGLGSVLTDSQYAALRTSTNELKKAWHNSLSKGEMTQLEHFKANPAILPKGNPDQPGFLERCDAFKNQCDQREKLAKSFIQEMVWKNHPNLKKAGVTSNLGFNFYDLRGPAYLIYPVNVHFRNTIPRKGKVNAGYGTMANWKATRNPGVPYSGASEGNRVAVGTPDENDYFAKYKESGSEGSVTFTAEFAGEGYTDNLADEHLRDLHRLWLAEEGMIINGNSGVSGSTFTGFKLGTCPTPAGVAVASHTVGATGNLSVVGNADLPFTTALVNTNYVSVLCVPLTAMGNPNNTQYGYGVFPTTSGGLTPQYARQNADGSVDIINGGMGAISAQSTAVQATTGNLTIRFALPSANIPYKGAFGYAWYVDVEATNTTNIANAKLAGITTTPFCFVSGTATGTQAANFTNGSLAGITADNSFNSLDFDGLTTYAANTAGAYYTDLQGGTLTSQKNGRVTELETLLQYVWQNYQTGIDEIWGDANAVATLDAAIRYSGTTNSGFQFVTTRDGQNNLLGGFVVSAYQSRYAFNSPNGSNAIPIRIHPMIPAGTLYFYVKNNPYPQSRIPATVEMLVQREYYSIEWPQTSRKWPFGTYVHECLAQYVPWIPSVITGIGPFSGS